MKRSLLLLALLITVAGTKAQLVINELSQGTTGTKEFVEFVVIGNKTCTDSCADIRGWIFDDNNGWHGTNGVATGCLRFANIAQWQCVPYGSIILVYNDGDKNTNITQADDVSDVNNDGIYIIPVNSNVLDKDNANPSGSSSAYTGLTFTNGGANWTPLGMRNAGDAFHTVSPGNLTSAYFAIGWGDVSTANTIYFAGAAGGLTYYMSNSISNDIYNQSNWVSANAGTASETPGLPNTVANAQWLLSLRNALVPSGTTIDTNVVRLCAGQTYFAHGANQSTPGFYRDTLSTTGGCDSIIVTDLRISPTATSQNQTLNGCGSVTISGHTFTNSTTYIDTLFNQAGCDSVHRNFTININSNSSYTNNVCINTGQTYFAGGANQTTTGVYTDTLPSANGCDSIITTNLYVVNKVNTTLNLDDCTSVIYKGNTYTTNTTLLDTLRSFLGCDSVITTVSISITPSIVTNVSACINTGQSYFAGGANQTAAGVYHDTLTSVHGCDSIINTTLSVITPSSASVNLQDCSSVTYHGNTYTASTTVTDTLRSTLGCDSVITTASIVIDPSLSVTTNKSVCILQGQSYFAGGANQTSTGVYTDSLTSSHGCDSIAITHLQVITPSQTTVSLDSCGQAFFDGVLYTSDVTLNDTVFSTGGCDSIYRQVAIRIHANPQFVIQPSTNISINKGDSAQLSLSNTFASVMWAPLAGLSSSNTATTSASPNTTTLYNVTVVDSNGCTATDTVLINVILPFDYAIPTAFSPNGDGKNDVFRVLLKGNAQLETLRIYNRWGEKVFETSSGNDGWDGTFRNVPQPVGTFVYYAQVKNLNTNKIEGMQGNVTLLR